MRRAEDCAILFLFILFSALLTGILTIFLGAVLMANKMVFVLGEARRSRLETYYLSRLSALLFEEAPDESAEVLNARFKYEILMLKKHLDRKPPLVRRHNRSVLRNVLLELAAQLRGETFERLQDLFEQLGFVAAGIKELDDDRWWIRARACRRLGLMRSNTALLALVETTNDEDEDVRIEAAQAIVDIAGVAGVPVILANLRSISAWMSIRLSRTLQELGMAATPALIDAVGSESESVRIFAIEMLGTLQDNAAVPAILDALPGLAGHARAAALVSLGKMGDERGVKHLLRNLGAREEEIRAAAARGLGSLGALHAVRALHYTLMNDSLAVRMAAGKALAALDEGGRKKLESALRSDDRMARQIALHFLDEAGCLPAL